MLFPMMVVEGGGGGHTKDPSSGPHAYAALIKHFSRGEWFSILFFNIRQVQTKLRIFIVFFRVDIGIAYKLCRK